MPARKTDTASGVKAPVALERITDEEITVPVIGQASVIPHKWGEKALRMMRAKQFGEVQTRGQAREPKDPDEEAENACYRLPDGRAGIPATAFKGAMVAACRFFSGLPMTEGRLMVYVKGEGPDNLVPLTGTEKIREDMPRNATGVVDLRYRTALLGGDEARAAGVEPWKADVTIVFPPKLIAVKSVIALLDAAGRVGVGDWRPGSPKSNTGTYGTFRINDEVYQEAAA